MKLFAPALTAIGLSCSLLTANAEPSPAPADAGMLSRIGHWFGNDWDMGWETGSTWRVIASPYTYHYTYNPEHTNVYMLGVERLRSDGFLVGGSVFQNSFGQPSAYAYVGQHFDKLLGVEPMFAQLTGGLLYGYKPPFDHKVPLNYRGFSPGFVASVGWQFTPVWSAQVNVLGNSALMFQFSADFH